ncbi:eukaryotic translation initiation factor 3 subunit A-like [Camellia sinensis]|uniref:eukaryotic translation initiation factor 3 subunit A-like n=1 Tax=Camellia sinensis TaxID=4442 RepID=UPI001036BD41|nr:eukaryotic translation initiation factor 3 subunit A-like [Camellia sinensis]
MAQEEVVNVRVDSLGDDDAEELAARYRTETQMVGVGESQASALILAPKPLSQVEPDQWHTKADKSTLTTADLEVIRERYQIPAEPKSGDLGRAELEARRKAQEVEDRAVLAKATKLKEAQRDRPPQPIARERIRPRPRPLGEKDLSSFEPRPPPVDPIKEQAKKEGEALKKKKKKMSAPEEAAYESGAKRAKVAPTEVEVPLAKDAPKVVEIIPTVEVVEIAPTVQMEARRTEAVPSGREQVQKRPDPQEGGKRLEESKRACAVAVERHEEAMVSNEELVRQKDEADSRIGDLLKELGEERARAEEEKGRLLREWEIEKAKAVAELESLKKGVEEERATAAAERGALQRELDEERAKAASERAAYPDLCVAAVEQYKGSPEFQMVVDAAVAKSLAGQESGGVGPSRKTVGVLSLAEALSAPTG